MSKNTANQAIKIFGTFISIFLMGATVRYPAYAGWFAGIGGTIAGWLHLPQPQTAQLPALKDEQ